MENTKEIDVGFSRETGKTGRLIENFGKTQRREKIWRTQERLPQGQNNEDEENQFTRRRIDSQAQKLKACSQLLPPSCCNLLASIFTKPQLATSNPSLKFHPRVFTTFLHLLNSSPRGGLFTLNSQTLSLKLQTLGCKSSSTPPSPRPPPSSSSPPLSSSSPPPSSSLVKTLVCNSKLQTLILQTSPSIDTLLPLIPCWMLIPYCRRYPAAADTLLSLIPCYR